MEQYYLTRSVENNKFQSFLALSKGLGVDEDTSTRSFLGLLKNGIHLKAKHVNWVKVVGVTHLSSHRQGLPFLVQVFQVFISSIAHHLLSVLIVHIFVDAGREQLQWLH